MYTNLYLFPSADRGSILDVVATPCVLYRLVHVMAFHVKALHLGNVKQGPNLVAIVILR
jgi:hypothetical protein